MNETTQDERREVLKDTLLARAQADVDLTSQGRFKQQTTAHVSDVPTYPTLPASSPWSKGLDEIVGVEPELGFAVDESLDTAEAPIEAVSSPSSSVELPAVSSGEEPR